MRVLESCLYAEDLIAAQEFYVGVLGLEQISFDPDRDLDLRCEESILIIFKASKTVIDEGFVPPHGTAGSGHLAFATTYEELGSWNTRLSEAGVKVIKEIRWKNGAKSLYFYDPAGNVLEFATPNLWGYAVN